MKKKHGTTFNRRVAMAFLLLAILCGKAAGDSVRLPATNGNRYLPGSIELNYAIEISVPLPDTPVWIVGDGNDESSTWFVMLENGRVFRIVIGEFGETEVADLGKHLPSSDNLDLYKTSRGYTLLPQELYLGNPTGRPLVTVSGRVPVAIDSNGRLYVGRGDTRRSASPGVKFLPDSRILDYGHGELLVLGNPTDRYAHGILGDDLEAGAFYIVDIDNEVAAESYVIDDSSVFETTSPIIADTDGDGTLEIVMTRSDADTGARLEVYSGTQLVAQGAPVGRSNRWIHAIAAAATGPAGEVEVIAVKTPHIGGALEYYQRDGDTLSLVYTRSGVSTHRIGSRNLDMALTGDFNGDGEIEVLVPSQDFSRLLSFKRTEDGSVTDATQYLQGRLSTNIAGFSYGGKICIAVGTSDDEFLLIRDF